MGKTCEYFTRVCKRGRALLFPAVGFETGEFLAKDSGSLLKGRFAGLALLAAAGMLENLG